MEKEKKKGLDIRGFFVIWEHKTVLDKALDYLWGEQWETEFPEVGLLLKELKDYAKLMVNLCLKYNMTRKAEILNRLERYTKEMFNREKIFFPMLINTHLFAGYHHAYS